ncbi:signal peptidase I [Oscillatoria sp. HE19RPO]|uniref:signal peptidase I n=1 Tax=Oscillatoria sp. HE19RPO TaxID=2954806 RepID=UPI0020C1FDB1|nr:signal peptidase I [Oscillatoria sp. HE19RPO]
MSNQQNRFFRYLRLAFVALAFVLYPYFINQLPPLPEWIGNVPTPVAICGAIVFALIVVVGPELLNVKETPPEELWRKLLQENQKLINDRLKNSLDQDSHIPITTIDSPGDLERPRRKAPQESSVKGWRTWWQNLQPSASLPKAIADKLPLIKTRRNLENLQTEEVTQLSPSKPIVEIFKEANKRLLILGEPGSGKTTELLKLAQALGEVAENNPKEPIPFIFELSAWRGERMLDWMVGEIVAQYGLNPKLCREWLIFDRIVPLLDGLDELGEERAKEAIRAIDALQADYHNQQKALVICCRVTNYERITDNNRRIRLKGVERAVRLCELTDDQIEGYLKQRKAEHIWDELQSNSGLMELARNPMLLNLMPIAYPDELPDNLPQNSQDFQSRLFDAFLHRKLSSTLAGYDPEKTKYYLAWLAASMGREDINQREFLIERLQPNWLETQKQRNQYSRINKLILGLIGGLISGLILGLILGPVYGLMGGLILGPIYGIMGGLISNFDSIDLIEKFDISGKNLKRAFLVGLYYSVILGIFLGLISWSYYWLIGGLVYGLNYGLIEGLKTDIKIRKFPNQGTRKTGWNSLITMVIAIPFCFLIWIVPRWATGQDWDWTGTLSVGGFLGIFFGYYLGGGKAFIQHFTLHWVLCHHGRIPRNYVHFLNEASACGILKQSGGRYRFYHDKFREHLAFTIQLKVEPVSSRKKYNFFGVSLQEIGIVFTAILLAVILTNTFGFNPDSVSAMNPLIQTSDRVFFDRLTYPRWRQPQRYQVISFATKNLEENFSKHFASRRILALPGERLEISSGQIILNGKPLDDNRIKLPSDFNQSLITLATDEYYVVADNLNYANFETFGAVVPQQKIRGQLILRVYPFDRLGLIR